MTTREPGKTGENIIQEKKLSDSWMCTFMVSHVLVHTNKSMRVRVFVYSFVSLVCLACICVRDVKLGLPAKTCLSDILSICESSSCLKANIKALVRREAVVSFGARLKQLQHA